MSQTTMDQQLSVQMDRALDALNCMTELMQQCSTEYQELAAGCDCEAVCSVNCPANGAWQRYQTASHNRSVSLNRVKQIASISH